MVPHLGGVGEIVGPDVLLSWAPNRHNREAVRELHIVELGGEALEGGVRGAARYELAPALATHCEGGYDPPQDEDTPQVVHDQPVAPPPEEDTGGRTMKSRTP
jgi:hypothetical protein